MWLKILIIYNISLQFNVLLFVIVDGHLLPHKNDRTINRQQQSHYYTIDELMTTVFPKKSSNDLDMDPCKAGKSYESIN